MRSGLIVPAAGLAILPIAIAVADSGKTGTTSSGSGSIASVGLGTASADRLICACVTVESNQTPNGLSVGGNAMSKIIGATDPSPTPDTQSAIFTLLVPTGATATFSLTLSGSGSDNWGLTVFAVTGGLAGYPVVHDFDGAANSVTRIIPVAADGGAIHCTAANGAGGTPVNCTEASDFNVGSDGHITGYALTTLGTLTIGTSGPTSSNCATCAVSFE